jgi:hypothetical protein
LNVPFQIHPYSAHFQTPYDAVIFKVKRTTAFNCVSNNICRNGNASRELHIFDKKGREVNTIDDYKDNANNYHFCYRYTLCQSKYN